MGAFDLVTSGVVLGLAWFLSVGAGAVHGLQCGRTESVLDAAFFSSGDSDTASVSEAEALDSSQVDTESDDWTEGLLPAAVQAISATKEAHRGHFLAAR